ncbi:MAG: hypothetical protein HFE39_10300 [Clostridiales bacterium]|nr:hypothetical protein [Clostridiales bacterium]
MGVWGASTRAQKLGYDGDLNGDYMQMKDTLKNQQKTIKKEFTKDQQDFLRE